MSDDWNTSNHVPETYDDDENIRDNWEDEDPVSDTCESLPENKSKETGNKLKTTTEKLKSKTAKSNDQSSSTAKDETIPNSTDNSEDSSQRTTEQTQDNAVQNQKTLSLDDIVLTTREQMLDYSLRLTNHLQPLLSNEFYPDFLDQFLNGITKSMSADQVKRLNAVLQAAVIRKKSNDREQLKKSKGKKTDKPQLADKSRKGPLDCGMGEDVDDDDYDYEDDDY